MSIAERIKEAMDKAGINAPELARRTKKSKQSIYKLLKGTTQEPRASTIDAIAKALNVHRIWLEKGGHRHLEELARSSTVKVEQIQPRYEPGLNDLIEAYRGLTEKQKQEAVKMLKKWSEENRRIIEELAGF